MHQQIASPRHGSSGIAAFQSHPASPWQLARVLLPDTFGFAPIKTRPSHAA
jgi:hypothetical protein